ncbi:MAG: hypothetical protein ABR968_04995 [Bacteroidales bacterium]
MNKLGIKLSNFGIKLNGLGIKLNGLDIKLNGLGIKSNVLDAFPTLLDRVLISDYTIQISSCIILISGRSLPTCKDGMERVSYCDLNDFFITLRVYKLLIN